MNPITKKKVKSTRKKKNNKINKKALWAAFDDESESKSKTLECLYSTMKPGNREKCDACNYTLFYSHDRFLTCSNTKCGIIYKDTMDESAEWRYYGADDNNSTDPTRCGIPINPLLKESSYGCKVVCNYKSSYEMRKIRRYTEWQAMPYKEKSQYDEFERIKLMSRNSGLPKMIIDESLRQHKKISEMKTFRGCNREGVIAASVYIACRIYNYPRTAKEIAAIFILNQSSATKGCKNAIHLLNEIEKNSEANEKTHFYETTPIAFIERYCSKMSLNEELTKVCKFVAYKIQKNRLMPENTPHSVAAGVVYFVAQSCNLNITKKNVNSCSEISEVTINKCYKKLTEMRNKLIPPTIIKKYTL
jgi:transcription initiation factor TFIIB